MKNVEYMQNTSEVLDDVWRFESDYTSENNVNTVSNSTVARFLCENLHNRLKPARNTNGLFEGITGNSQIWCSITCAKSTHHETARLLADVLARLWASSPTLFARHIWTVSFTQQRLREFRLLILISNQMRVHQFILVPISLLLLLYSIIESA